MENVVVAVCTRERPRSLARLLVSLAAHAAHARVIVVDNDPNASARATVEAAPVAACYIHEPRVGIPQARNAAFDAVDAKAAIAFVDDDETIEPGWLEALAAMRQSTGAAIVTGPVRPAYDDAVPDWVRRGGFFERRIHSHGVDLPFAATNNLLIGPELRMAGLRFDERLALTGGSDAVLTLQACHRGFRIVWAADAVVTEHVPPERARVGWLCRRAYRVGVMLGALAAVEPAATDRTSVRAVKSVGQVVVGATALAPWTMARGRPGAVAALRLTCRGMGGLAGLLGRRYHEYAATP